MRRAAEGEHRTGEDVSEAVPGARAGWAMRRKRDGPQADQPPLNTSPSNCVSRNADNTRQPTDWRSLAAQRRTSKRSGATAASTD